MEAPKPASQTIQHPTQGVADKSNWTMNDYLTKDTKALEELMASDPQKVRELNTAYQQQQKNR